MWKGILFVIAIIITFDIGKALLESWDAEENASSESTKEKVVDKAEGKLREDEKAGENSVEGIRKEKVIKDKPSKELHDTNELLDTHETPSQEGANGASSDDSDDGSGDEKVRVLIDLSLPKEEPERRTPGELNQSENMKTDSKQSVSNDSKEKKVSMSAKPIVSFNKEVSEKPRLEGAEVGLKMKLD